MNRGMVDGKSSVDCIVVLPEAKELMRNRGGPRIIEIEFTAEAALKLLRVANDWDFDGTAQYNIPMMSTVRFRRQR